MIKSTVNAFKQMSKNRIFQHVLFWSMSFLILTNIFKVSVEIKEIDLIYTAIFHVPILLIVYLNLRFLFPLFLETRRYLLYGLSVLILISAGAGFYIILFDSWIDYIFSGYYFIAYYGFLDISLYLVIYLFVTSLLRLARGWFHLQEIEKEKTLAELKALKSQINPHFLFNSLNSIYSLARKNSAQVPEKVIQLSDLMRHIIYDSDVEFVLLPREIDMIRNYIELQNLRTPEKEKIELEVIGEIEGKKVAPLIFLPFVENSFKHGLKSGAENPFVKIKIEVLPNELIFEIENSKGKTSEIHDSKYKGIGIENVKKRLGLIYPNLHSLNISENETIFKVILKIKWN